MRLHNDTEKFAEYVQIIANARGMSPAQVEKDYYVTLLLSELTKRLPNLLFKGGTSLSKCHKVIERFSEDIDLSLEQYHFTQGQKRKVKYALLDACDVLGFKVLNVEKTRSRRDYNNYEIQYPIKYFAADVKPIIKAETVYIQKAYPDEIMPVTSIIYDYLKVNGKDVVIEKYSELQPFDIRVQTLERTFVDKVFAICDYKISNTITRNSRHVYDLFRLLSRVRLDDNLRELAKEVRADRKLHERCYSAQDGIDVPKILEEIIDSGIYKDDYETITAAMMYKGKYLPYDEAIKALDKIIESNVFDFDDGMGSSKKKEIEME